MRFVKTMYLINKEKVKRRDRARHCCLNRVALLRSPTYLLQRRFHKRVNTEWEERLRTLATNFVKTHPVQTNELKLQHFLRGAIQENSLNRAVKVILAGSTGAQPQR